MPTTQNTENNAQEMPMGTRPHVDPKERRERDTDPDQNLNTTIHGEAGANPMPDTRHDEFGADGDMNPLAQGETATSGNRTTFPSTQTLMPDSHPKDI